MGYFLPFVFYVPEESLLLTFDIFTRTLSGKTQNQLLAVSAILVMLMGLMMTDRELKMTQSGYNFATVMEPFSASRVENFAIMR